MYTNNLEQLIKFCYFFITGIILSIIFDIFRILRRSFKTSDLITNIEDIVYGIITGIIIIFSIYLFNNGELRFYIFVGMLIGIITYILLFSKYFIQTNVMIISYIKKALKLFLKPFIFLLKLIKKIFLKPISFIFINIKGIATKFFLKNFKIAKKNKKEINQEGF